MGSACAAHTANASRANSRCMDTLSQNAKGRQSFRPAGHRQARRPVPQLEPDVSGELQPAHPHAVVTAECDAVDLSDLPTLDIAIRPAKIGVVEEVRRIHA